MMEDSPNSQTKHWGSTSEEILRTNFPLHRACRDGDTEALSMLLIQAQHGVYVEDSFYGWTPAHWSAYFGKLDCLRKLMSITRVGADCNIKTSRFDQTPAHFAAFGGHPRCLLWLVMASADLDAQDYLGETPLHKAARSGSMECVSLLVSHGAKLFIRNHNGMTSSQLASTCGHAECSKSLEAAALRSEEHCRSQGIYREQVIQPHLGQPSPHDVTTNGADPRLTVSGGSVQNIPSGLATGVMNGGSEDCEMDEDVSPSNNMLNGFASPPNTPAPFNANGDVTLSTAISSNQAPVAGRKRCREDTEETEYKRMRKNVNTTPVGWEKLAEFNSDCIACDNDDQVSSPSAVTTTAEYGYDYNGIPQEECAPSVNVVDSCPPVEMDMGEKRYPAKALGLTGHYL